MDAIDVLKSDHDKARDLFMKFRQAEEAEDQEMMAEVVEKIFDELETHTAIEERVFYPAVREAGGGSLDDLTDESNEEHHVVDVLIEEIRNLTPSDDAYVAKMTVLIENVEHHAGEEEEEMFPKVRELMSGDRLAELGRRLEREKHVVRLEKKSVDELREEAAALEIDGRSTMDRNALVGAIIGQYQG